MPERRRQAPRIAANIVRRGPSRMPMVLRSRSVGCRSTDTSISFSARRREYCRSPTRSIPSQSTICGMQPAGAIPRLRRHLDAELIVVRPGIEAGLRQAHMSVHDLGCSPIPGRGQAFSTRRCNSPSGPTPITGPELYSSREGSIAPTWKPALSSMSSDRAVPPPARARVRSPAPYLDLASALASLMFLASFCQFYFSCRTIVLL